MLGLDATDTWIRPSIGPVNKRMVSHWLIWFNLLPNTGNEDNTSVFLGGEMPISQCDALFSSFGY